MTKGIFFAVSLVLVSAVAGCSADTAEESTAPTTDTNGTSPAVDEAKLPTSNAFQQVDLSAAREIADRGARREGLRGAREVGGVPFTMPNLELTQPEVEPKREPLNQ